MNVFVHTLGCRVNQYESQLIREELSDLPYSGELHVVNTCTVTALADRKGRKLVRRLKRNSPMAFVVAVGCGVDGAADALRLAGADLVVGNRDKARLREVVEAFLQREEIRPGSWLPLDEERVRGPMARTRALLKVQDGCTVGCSFCRAWQVRGPLRSKSPESARLEAEALAQAGHQEIVIIGINLAQYGVDLPDRPTLSDLLRELLRVPRVRIRLSSLNPEGLTDDLILLFVQEERLCPYLHLSLQSGDDRVLEKMGRPYTAAEYEERARAFLAQVPKATLGTDVLVGFPGEDERAFQRTVDLLARLIPLNVHVFRFSPRPGTLAANFPGQIPPEVKARRAKELSILARAWANITCRRFLGQTLNVILEEKREDRWWGHAENYVRVGLTTGEAKRGKIVPVRLLRVEEGHMLGVIANRSEEL